MGAGRQTATTPADGPYPFRSKSLVIAVDASAIGVGVPPGEHLPAHPANPLTKKMINHHGNRVPGMGFEPTRPSGEGVLRCQRL